MGRLSDFMARWRRSDAALRALVLGILFLGINNGILNSTFNNYLHDTFAVDAAERGFIELPRELPGFAIIFVTGLLAAYSMRVWAVLVGLLSAVGVIGLGWLSPTTSAMLVWMMLWSLADHLMMPVESALGLQLAHSGGLGRRLGQLSGARNLAMIAGTLVVAAVMSRGWHSYGALYLVAGVCALVAARAFAAVRVAGDQGGTSRRFVARREYGRFYLLNMLFGARKQIFLTFGPWVLVTVFGTPPETVALLLMVSSAIGVVFRQALGELTDRFGERAVLVADAVIFFGICLGYAWSHFVYLLFALYILDNLMFASRIARTTYLSRIAVDRRDIPSTLSLGVTLDHVVSMTMPMLGGLLWQRFGYPAVFLAASAIALANLWVATGVGVAKSRGASEKREPAAA